eukprot:82727-Prorocentrum_minimum.AAC.4
MSRRTTRKWSLLSEFCTSAELLFAAGFVCSGLRSRPSTNSTSAARVCCVHVAAEITDRLLPASSEVTSPSRPCGGIK